MVRLEWYAMDAKWKSSQENVKSFDNCKLEWNETYKVKHGITKKIKVEKLRVDIKIKKCKFRSNEYSLCKVSNTKYRERIRYCPFFE